MPIYIYIYLSEPGNGKASAKTYAGFGKLVLLVAQFPDLCSLKGVLMFCVWRSEVWSELGSRQKMDIHVSFHFVK